MEFIVKYELDDEIIERLKALQAAYQAKGYDMPIEDIFSTSMQMGCREDILKRIVYIESNIDKLKPRQ